MVAKLAHAPSTLATGGWTGADTYHTEPIRHFLLGGWNLPSIRTVTERGRGARSSGAEAVMEAEGSKLTPHPWKPRTWSAEEDRGSR